MTDYQFSRSATRSMQPDDVRTTPSTNDEGADPRPSEPDPPEASDPAVPHEKFLAMLSHELRSPLGAVLNAVKLLDGPHPGPHPASTCRRAVDVIARQTRHMARLLDDLLDLSRLSRGRFELRRERCDVRPSIRSAAETTRPLADARDVSVVLDLGRAPATMNADAARLEQVVSNLLSNAIRHSDPGGEVTILVGLEPTEIVVVVSDDGSGIAPELLPNVFEPFVQAEQALDRAAGGLGLGLALVRDIVRLHGGTVTARSDGFRRGSEFEVRLPRAIGGPRAEPESVPKSRSARGLSIVLVEDQPDAREMLEYLLRSKGHEVVAADDGEAGISAIERTHPDCALVDIGLPSTSGYEVARRIRADPALHDVYLVALTGYGSKEDVEAATRHGFDQHFTKPIDHGRLASLLAELAQRS